MDNCNKECTSMDFTCSIYSGPNLEHIDVVNGDSLQDVVQRLNEVINHIHLELPVSLEFTNAGSGVELLQSTDGGLKYAFKSLSAGTGITIEDNQTVTISLDQDLLSNYNSLAGIELLDTSDASLGKFYIKKLVSTDSSIQITETPDGNIDLKVTNAVLENNSVYTILPSTKIVTVRKDDSITPSGITVNVTKGFGNQVALVTEGELRWRLNNEIGSGTLIGFGGVIPTAGIGSADSIDITFKPQGSAIISAVESILINKEAQDGQNSNGVFTSIVFKRSNTQPTTPTGGSYENPVPTGWYDGIPAEQDGMPLWMTSRVFSTDGTYPQQETWSTPVLAADTDTLDIEWSNYTGSDPGTPTTNPENWGNNPTPDDIWMAIAVITNGLRGPWKVQKVKGEKGENGEKGQSVLTSIVFKRDFTDAFVEAPVGGSYGNPVPVGWSDGIPPEDAGKAVWMSTRVFTSDGLSPQGDWTPPQLAYDTANIDFEWSNYTAGHPGTPDTNPELWDNVASEDDVWMAISKINNGVREPWVVQKIYGEKGETGASILTSTVFKRSHTQPAVPTGGDYYNPVPTGWYDGIPPEQDGMPVWMSTRRFDSTGDGMNQTSWSQPQLLIDTATIDYEFSANDVEDPGTPSAPLNGAVWNNNSTEGTIWMAVQRTINGLKTEWEVIKVKGEGSFIWIKYADTIYGGGMSDSPVGTGDSVKPYIGIAQNMSTSVESTNPADYVWRKYVGDKGLAGASVKTSFIFKRSSTQPATPTGGSYISPVPAGWSDGIPEESFGMPVWMSMRVFTSDGQAPQEAAWKTPELAVDNGTTDFEWSSSTSDNPGTPSAPLNGAVWSNDNSVNTVWMATRDIRNGTTGAWKITKIKGEEGATLYMWVKYSKYPNGRDTNGDVAMYDDPVVNINGTDEFMTYTGTSVNNPVEQESNVPEDYKWMRTRGEDGNTGYILELSNDNTSVPATSTGTFPNPATAFANANTQVTLYYGNDTVDISEYGIVLTPSSGITYDTNIDKTSLQVTGLTADTAKVLFTAHPKVEGVINTQVTIAKSTFSITKVRNTAVYEIVPSTTSIKIDGDGTVLPSTVSARVLINNGDTNAYTSTGSLTYRYLYLNNLNDDSDDGTPIGIGANITVSKTNNPLYIEFKYFHPTTGELVDRERLPIISDGLNTTYEETRYAKTPGDNIIPAISNATLDPGANWTLNPPQIVGSEALWMTKATKKSKDNTLHTNWSNPVRTSGVPGPPGNDGNDGADGNSGYSIVSNNPMEALAVGSDNAVGSTVNFDVSFAGYLGITQLEATDNATRTDLQFFVQLPTGLRSGLTVTKLNVSTLRFTVYSGTLFNGTSEVIPIILKMGSTNLELISSFSIVPIASAEDAYSLRLNADALVVKYSASDSLIGPSSIILTAVQQNYSEAITWSSTPAGIVTGTGNVKTINSVNLFSGGNTSAKIKVETPNGLSDEVTIVKVQDGPKGDPGNDGSDGLDGINGTTGPSPRTFEWQSGATYRNGGGYIDYIYYRGNTALETDPTRGWYTVKPVVGQDPTTAVANATGAPNAAFEKAPFQEDMTFGTVIAEQANLAGFLFRNQLLTSQAKSDQVCEGVATRHPNLTLDGIQGIIKFLDRMTLDKSGIQLKDDCGNPRMLFQWDQVSGVPILKFLNTDGSTKWEAGESGYKIIVTGTQPSTRSAQKSLIRVQALKPYDETSAITVDDPVVQMTVLNSTLSDSVGIQARDSSRRLIYQTQQLDMSGGNVDLTDPYYIIYSQTAFPTLENLTNEEYIVTEWKKGDMSGDTDKYDAWYRGTGGPIVESTLGTAPVDTFAPDGWYFMQGVSGENRNTSSVYQSTVGVYPFMEWPDVDPYEVYGFHPVELVYMKNGNIVRSVRYVEKETWQAQ